MRLRDWSSDVWSSHLAIEVEQQARATALLVREGGERRVEFLRDMEAVREPGQRIIEREPRGGLGRAALRGDVGAAAAIAHEPAAAVEMRTSRHRPPAVVALAPAAQRQ